MSFVIRTNPDLTGTIRRTYVLLFALFLALIYFVAVAVRFTAFFTATAPYGAFDHFLRAQARLGSTPSLFWEPLCPIILEINQVAACGLRRPRLSI